MLGAIVASLLAQTDGDADLVLVLDSELDLADEPCSISFVLLPTDGGVDDLLAPLGLAPRSDGIGTNGRDGRVHGSGDELVAIGLGSCIGLALIDRSAGVAGLAHVVLPEAGAASDPGQVRRPGRAGADRPGCSRAGASPRRLEAVLVGGARMFELGALDIGARNEEAVREALPCIA